MTRHEKAYIRAKIRQYETWAAEEEAAAKEAPDEMSREEYYRQASLHNAKAIALEHLLIDLGL